jgi:CTP:phosphocholine cytidylyltransferase-like protein/thiamine kinase-like enzyme
MKSDEFNRNKVDNAIIMAAGLSSRFAPLSFERPKGLLEVKGEILIERQIKQLQEAGITDITIVVGYMKESFYYLKDKFNVEIIVNNEYNKRNNNSTLYLVKEKLKNTYICSSDNYFTKNIFESHVPFSYYSAVYSEGDTDEYCITTDENDIIIDAQAGGHDSWIMLGHVYFSKEFSAKFVEILERVYNEPGVDRLLWEDIYISHIKELPMKIRQYDKNDILEFDSLDDLKNFDSSYIKDTRSKIIKNICSILKCEENEVCNVVQIKKGLTNISFLFEVKNEKYIYRHPGIGTEEIINRESECFSQHIARELGLDNTFIYMCHNEGWKISRFVDNCRDFNYGNPEDVKKGLSLVKKLHDSCIKSKWEFNIFEESEKLLNLIKDNPNLPHFNDIESLRKKISKLYKYAENDNIEKCLCHNDCYDPNFLTDDNNIYLIDWEYSGNADPASDIGTFICCSDYTIDEAMEVLKVYFGRDLTLKEKSHYLAYIGINSYYWFIWALYKTSNGEDVGNYLELWYQYANIYGDIALDLYEDKN